MAVVTFYPQFNGWGFPIIRSPEWKTIIQTTDSGKEYALRTWISPKYTWKVQWNYLFDDGIWGITPIEVNNAKQQLEAFFNMLAGMYNRFWYIDPYDHTVTTEIAIASGDGATKDFPVFRVLQAGAYSAAELVQGVNGAILNVFLNGVQTFNYTLSQPPVTLHFNSPPSPGVVISWTTRAPYQLLFLCRMTKDRADFGHIYHGVWEAKDFEFQSVLA